MTISADFYQRLLGAARERPEYVDYEIAIEDYNTRSAYEEVLVRSDEDYKYSDFFNRIRRDISVELVPWRDERADVFFYGPITPHQEICDPYGAGFFQKIGLVMASYYSNLLLENLPEEAIVTKDYWIDDKGNINSAVYYAMNEDAEGVRKAYDEWGHTQWCKYKKMQALADEGYTWRGEMDRCFGSRFWREEDFNRDGRFVRVEDLSGEKCVSTDHLLVLEKEDGSRWHALRNHHGVTLFDLNYPLYNMDAEKPDNTVNRIEVRDRKNDGDADSAEGNMVWGGSLYIGKRSPYTEGMLAYFDPILKRQHFDEYSYKADARPTDVYFEKGDDVHKGNLLFKYATENSVRGFFAEEDGEVDSIDEGSSSYKWWTMKIKTDGGDGWFSWF